MSASIEDRVRAWGEDYWERWVERAAVKEYDGGMRRDLAEQAAYLEVGKLRREARR